MSTPPLPSLESLRQARVLGPLDLHFARAACRLAGSDDPLVLLGAAVASRAPALGHVCAVLSEVAARPEPREGEAPLALTWPEPEPWIAALQASPLVSAPGAPLVLEGDRLYLRRYWDYQQQLLTQLRRRAAATVEPDPALLAPALAALFPEPGQGLDLQRLATLMAALRRLTVISGGPGTGKTTTVVKILALLGTLHRGQSPGAAPRALLMAPTGKAAARLKQALREAKQRSGPQRLAVDEAVLAAVPEEASTIHRALGWQSRTPHRFRHHLENPLPADVVLVDEASMVPLSLMSKLVAAVPDGARLILLGDRNQLASVEAGAVLGDICGAGLAPPRGYSRAFARQARELLGQPLPEELVARGPVPAIRDCTVHLQRPYRFDLTSGIHALAQAVVAGADPDYPLALLLGQATEHPQGQPYSDLTLIPARHPAELEQALRRLALEAYRPLVTELDPARALLALDRFRILCAHRRGAFGVEGVGQQVERWLAAEGLINPAGSWYPGRPLLITENDYQLQLFNGDVGVVLPDPDPARGLRAHFPIPGGTRSLHPARLPAHETVYATTIHKSQGSEFEQVVIVLPPRPSPVLTRELLYTAVTRARRAVTVVGAPEVMRQGISQRISRASGLGQKLWQLPPG